MKKKILSLIVLVTVSSAMVFAFFPDVPKHHWAYEYVYKLWERGIFIGYPDKTFKGDRCITRYEAATAVSRLLDFIEEKVVGAKIEDLVTVVNGIALRTGELTRDVMKLKSSLEDLKAKIGDLEKALDEQSEEFSGKVKDVEKEVESLKKKVSEIELNLSGTISSLLDVAEKVKDIDTLKADLRDLEKDVEEIKSEVQALEIAVKEKADMNLVKKIQKELENKVSEVESAFDEKISYLFDEVDRLSNETQELLEGLLATREDIKEEIEIARKDIKNLGKNFEELKQTVLIHDKDILKLYENSATLEKDIAAVKSEIKKVESELEVKIEGVSNRLYAESKRVDALTNSVDELGNKIVELTFAYRNKDAELETMIKKVASESAAKDEELEKKIGYLEDYLSRDFTKKLTALEDKMNSNDKMLWTKIEGVRGEYKDEMSTMKKDLMDEIAQAESRAKKEAMKWGFLGLLVGVAGIFIAILGK